MKTNHRRQVKKKVKATKGSGFEYWGRRSAIAKDQREPGKYTKKVTHRAERRDADDDIEKRVEEIE